MIFTRAVSLLLGTAISIAVLAWIFLAPFRASNCEQRDVFSQATSPDGVWVATLYYNVCSDGAFVTTVTDTVEIKRPNDQSTPIPSAGTVFGMDDHPYGVPKTLAVRWTAPRHLEVTIPNDAWAGRQESAFADIAVSYKYDPDDPAERACLKEWRSLPTDEMVRRNFSPTEGIKAFLARCHAEGRPH
jgi:hypothetical protein